MNLHFCTRALILIAAVAAPVTQVQAQATAPASGAIQNQPRAEAALLPHGKCPTNYRLEFVSSKWMRCTLTPTAQTPKAPANAAPVCSSGYTLQDAAQSQAPERNLYRCVKS